MLIEQTSTLTHHAASFSSNSWPCHIGYIPNKKVIGLSKINRLVIITPTVLKFKKDYAYRY